MRGCRLMVRAVLITLALGGVSGGCAASQPATDIPIIVMADDGDPSSLAATNAASQMIGTKIKEQFQRYNYYVVDEHAVAAAFGFDFSHRMDSSAVLRAALQAKNSHRAEFDVRSVVIYRVFARARDLGFARQLSLEVAGEVHDADSGLYLGDFGPISRSFPASADCGDNACYTSVLRDHGADIAAIVADEARKKLALLTKPAPGALAAVAGADSASAGSAGPQLASAAVTGDAPAVAEPASPRRLVVAYNLRFENLSMHDVLRIKGVMESEFPDFVRAGRISGSEPVLQYGYVSRAPQDKLFEWVNILVGDMGMKSTKILADGNTITVKNLAGDMPAPSGQVARFK